MRTMTKAIFWEWFSSRAMLAGILMLLSLAIVPLLLVAVDGNVQMLNPAISNTNTTSNGNVKWLISPNPGIFAVLCLVSILAISRLQTPVAAHFYKPLSTSYLTGVYYFGGAALAVLTTLVHLVSWWVIVGDLTVPIRPILLTLGIWGMLYPAVREVNIITVFVFLLVCFASLQWAVYPVSGIFYHANVDVLKFLSLDLILAIALFVLGAFLTYRGIKRQRVGLELRLGALGNRITGLANRTVPDSTMDPTTNQAFQVWYEWFIRWRIYKPCLLFGMLPLGLFGLGLYLLGDMNKNTVQGLGMLPVLLIQMGVFNGLLLAGISALVPLFELRWEKSSLSYEIPVNLEHRGLDRFRLKLPVSDRSRGKSLLLALMKLLLISNLIWIVPLIVVVYAANSAGTISGGNSLKVDPVWVTAGVVLWNWLILSNASVIAFSKRPIAILLCAIVGIFLISASLSALDENGRYVLLGVLFLILLLFTVWNFGQAYQKGLVDFKPVLLFISLAVVGVFILSLNVPPAYLWPFLLAAGMLALGCLLPIASLPLAMSRARIT